MGLFNRKKSLQKQENRNLDEWQNPVLGTLNYGSYSTYKESKSLKLSTVWRCVNLISDSIASLKLLPYKYKGNWKFIDESNSLNNILNIQPNNFQSAYMFKKLSIVTMLNKGNAYIVIDKDKMNNALSLTLLNSDYVQVFVGGVLVANTVDITQLLHIGNPKITYLNMLSGKEYDNSQVIHLINYPDANGLMGYSTIEYAATILGIAYHTDNHSYNFFKGGANLGGILRPVAGGTLAKGQGKKAKDDFLNALNPVVGGKSGSVVVIDAGLEYQPISVNPKDSQMIENKAFNVLEICRFYGVPPSLAFSEGGKFNTAEQQSLDFMNNALLPLLEKVENEFFRKLYLPSEWSSNELRFDVENLIRLDARTKIDVLTKQIGIGIKTPNEGRLSYSMKYPLTGGNNGFISTNLQKLDNPVVQGPLDTVNNSARPKKEDEIVIEDKKVEEEKIIIDNKKE